VSGPLAFFFVDCGVGLPFVAVGAHECPDDEPEDEPYNQARDDGEDG
jgi:hypothetical protein